jgi:hypothetical protein
MAGADNAQQLDTQKRRAFVLELRKGGMTYRQISDAAIRRFGIQNLPKGWDCRYAAMDVKRELEKIQSINEQQAEDVRAIELERLDAILASIWARVKRGDLAAIDRVLKVMRRRADLMGLDAPSKHQLLDIDLSQLTDSQLARIADGEDIISVLATPGASGD